MYLDPHQNLGRGGYCETCLSPAVIFLLTIPRLCFVCGFLVICVCLCHTAMSASCIILVTWWEGAGLLTPLYMKVFFTLPYGVVLDYIDSWSLPSFK